MYNNSSAPAPTPPRHPAHSPEDTPSPANGTANGASPSGEGQVRRTSFNFLRRQKSGDIHPPANRSTSGSKMSKKQKARAQEELLRQQKAALPKSPPRLPNQSPLPPINSFGGDDARPDSLAIVTNRAGYGPASYHQAANQSRQCSMPGSENRLDSSSSPYASVPIPPIPGNSPSSKNGEYVDPYARTESMTNRGRYSYASSAVSAVNSPRRVRRRKDPTPFNILVIGAKNSGKTSFINFLKTSLTKPSKKRLNTPSPPPTGVALDSPFVSQYLETEVDHERIGVTLWDSRGLETNFVDLHLEELLAFLESKFEETFTEEQKVVRAPGVRDTHVHCVFLILDPSRLDANINIGSRKSNPTANKFGSAARVIGGLDEDLDLSVLRALQGKTTVIPVISKADTITTAHMTFLKKTVWASLKQAKLDPLEALNLVDSDDDSDRLDEREEDEYINSDDDGESRAAPRRTGTGHSSPTSDYADEGVVAHERDTSSTPLTSPPSAATHAHRRTASAMSATLQTSSDEEIPFIPLSIISPDTYEAGAVGRRFPWGFADPYNAAHCDFTRLKESVFSDWRAELREASRELWYEGWRTSRLKTRGTSSSGSPSANKSYRQHAY